MEVLEEWVMWNIVSVRLETELLSAQYRCTVCAKRTIGIEIVLNAPGGSIIGSEIILDASDDTPR
jgi:hypothetical protein